MLKDQDWGFILDTIKNEKCVLLLGPEICFTPESEPFEKAMLEHLDLENNENILTYYPNDSLFLFKDGIAKTRSYYKIKDFYKKGFKDNVYTTLAQIPFHLVISTNPDLNLLQIFEASNTPCAFAYYDKTANPDDVSMPTRNMPLIYNLFGSIEKEESMILTHNDLFDFLLAVLGSRNLPTELKNALLGADNYLFLGFKFDKWYVQLLLRLLNLHKENFKFARFASNKDLRPETRMMVSDQFKIEFVEDQIEQFVQQLFTVCEKGGIIRDLEETMVSVSELVEKYLEDDQLDKAFTAMKDFLENKSEEELVDDVTLLMGRHKRLVRKQNQGIIDEKDSGIEYNKIKVALLDLNREIKSLE